MNDDRDLLAYQHLWDGSERWVLWKCYHDLMRVALVFSGSKPTIAEVAAVRKLLPEYSQMAPREVMRQLGSLGRLDLEPLPTVRARELAEQARQLGLEVDTADASYTGYLPIQPNDAGGIEGSFALIMEDDQMAERVCDRMLRAGVPVLE